MLTFEGHMFSLASVCLFLLLKFGNVSTMLTL